MAEEEEVRMEVEAAEAVYGDDCIILNRFPPHLHLHIKPRIADVDSQQFVEATIELRADSQYPSDPPYVGIIGSKGLDEKRQKHLIDSLNDKAHELASCLMLVALCEVSSFNFFDLRKMMGDSTGNCPVCRKVFLAKDIEHVLNLVGSHDADSDVYEKELVEKVLQCDLETSRRQKFETILELQQQHGGLIEPPKDNILFSRFSLQDLVCEDAEVMNGEANEQQQSNQIVREEPESSSNSNRPRETRKQHQRGHTVVEPPSNGPPTRPNAGQRRHSGPRKHSKNYSRWQPKPNPVKE